MSLFTSLIWLKETDSTQNRLKEWNLNYGTVVVADRQTSGRGRLGRKWVSQEGGLYFSILLNPEEFKEILQLPLILGLSISETLEIYGFEPKIKWPNDVYIENKKVCGILCELSGKKLIAGIGVNLNQKNIPEELKEKATSIYLISGREINRKEFLIRALKRISENAKEFKRKGFKEFKEKLNKKLHFMGEDVKIIGEKVIPGKFVGISERGGALILTEEGIKEFLSGELSLRKL